MPGFVWRREKPVVMPRARKYPVELLERATRLVFESGRPIAHVARDLRVPSETLRVYVRQVEANVSTAIGFSPRADIGTPQWRPSFLPLVAIASPHLVG
jgi:transposase-like protein